MHLLLHFDGSCANNPGGPLGFGWHIDDDVGKAVAEESGPITGYRPEESTNNVAEFEALLAGLEWLGALKAFPVESLTIRGDSQLVVKIVSGKWKAKAEHLKALAENCKSAVESLPTNAVRYEWIPREMNSRADALAGEYAEWIKPKWMK